MDFKRIFAFQNMKWQSNVREIIQTVNVNSLFRKLFQHTKNLNMKSYEAVFNDLNNILREVYLSMGDHYGVEVPRRARNFSHFDFEKDAKTAIFRVRPLL